MATFLFMDLISIEKKLNIGFLSDDSTLHSIGVRRESITMLKKIVFFIVVTVLVMTSNIRDLIYGDGQHTEVTGTASIESASLPHSKFNAFPEDVFPFNADLLQNRLGCHQGNSRYIGYSLSSQKLLTVIRTESKDGLYTLGDALPGSDSLRIIWTDAKRVILHSADGIQILCRETNNNGKAGGAANNLSSESQTSPREGRKQGSKPHDITTQRSSSEINAQVIYNTDMGKLAGVTNHEGKVVGYQLISCQQYCWLLKKVNIQPGDIITNIQGEPIFGLSMKQIKDKVMSQHQDIRISISRNGQEKQVVLPWQTLEPLLSIIENQG